MNIMIHVFEEHCATYKPHRFRKESLIVLKQYFELSNTELPRFD